MKKSTGNPIFIANDVPTHNVIDFFGLINCKISLASLLYKSIPFTYRIAGKSDNVVDIKKELVIQKDGKECFVELPKGTYSFEVELPGKEIFRKGEYKFDDDVVITIKED